jgi:hypothetical protein
MTLLLVACSQQAGEPAAPAITEQPTPRPTDPPWSDKFAEHFCLAVNEHSIFVEDLESLQAAAEELDADKVSLYAYAAGADIEVIDASLALIAKEYPPSRALMVAWRRANAAFIKALADIDAGASSGSLSRLNRGSERIKAAAKLLGKTTPILEGFIAETGFECP